MASFSELRGRVVLITGGANGIGAAMVRSFHARGARVFFCDCEVKPGTALAKQLDGEVFFQKVDLLKERGAEMAYYDPHVPVIRPTREHPHWAGTPSVAWDAATVRGFDVVLIATHHAAVNHGQLAEWAGCIVDTRNAMAGIPTKPGQVWPA